MLMIASLEMLAAVAMVLALALAVAARPEAKRRS